MRTFEVLPAGLVASRPHLLFSKKKSFKGKMRKLFWRSDLAGIWASVESRESLLLWPVVDLFCFGVGTEFVPVSRHTKNSWISFSGGKIVGCSVRKGRVSKMRVSTEAKGKKKKKKRNKPQRDNWGINSSPGLCSGPIQSPLWLAPLPLSVRVDIFFLVFYRTRREMYRLPEIFRFQRNTPSLSIHLRALVHFTN